MNCIKISEELKNHFFKKTIKKENGCLEWHKVSDKDCGLYYHKGKRYRAHRFAWILHNDDNIDEFLVRRICKNKMCVNINHLFLDAQK
jgi:hypothetical protein